MKNIELHVIKSPDGKSFKPVTIAIDLDELELIKNKNAKEKI